MDRALDTDIKMDALPHSCGACGRLVKKRYGFAFKSVAPETDHDALTHIQEIVKCIYCAIRHTPMLRRSLKVAIVVGTVLTLLNQADTIFSGYWPNALYWKIPLTYCVPFLVATYGALANIRR